MGDILKNGILSTIRRTKELINSNILWDRRYNLLRRSALIEILILLNDLLIKSDKHFNKRINFTDDVKITNDVKDVTELIAYFRNACCHEFSKLRKFNGGVFVYNEFIKTSLDEKDVIEEIGFNMGGQVLYLKKHIERAFSEVESILKPYVYRS
jgi:hypothetical protein